MSKYDFGSRCVRTYLREDPLKILFSDVQGGGGQGGEYHFLHGEQAHAGQYEEILMRTAQR